ncbi:MAG: aminoacyl-tRNA hydrolase [Ignavibacteria bacterium]
MNNTKLVVGLGNPGKKYQKTRHNTGFLVLDKLAGLLEIKSSETEEDYEFAVKEYKDNTIVLMKPLTFMNRSGFALREFFENYEISAENVLIIYDDVNLDFGTLRMRPSGSDGGQRGMHSIIYEMHTEDIPRLRVGIKNEKELEKFRMEEIMVRDKDIAEENDEQEEGYAGSENESIEEQQQNRYNLADYVLSEFTAEEKKNLDKVTEIAKDAVVCFIENGIKEAMNRFNKNVLE